MPHHNVDGEFGDRLLASVAPRGALTRRALIMLTLGVITLVAAAAGCKNDSDRTTGPVETEAASAPVPFSTPQQSFALYEPPADEPYTNGKRLAGRVAQQLATFRPRASIDEISNGVAPVGQRPTELARIVAPLLAPEYRSTGEVIYVQLSGVTATTLGAIVLVRQHLEDATGTRDVVVRVMDVRLRLTDGASWSLDRVASVGGSPVQRPENISPAAARVLDHPNIRLPDTVRWDIYRGLIDVGLLRALSDAADRWPFAVMVLRTGHPNDIWATGRRSAHSFGGAVDIYAVDGKLVLHQRAKGSSAYRLASTFLTAGAAKVGSPWILPAGGGRSFTDRVHQDHLHLQYAPSRQLRP